MMPKTTKAAAVANTIMMRFMVIADPPPYGFLRILPGARPYHIRQGHCPCLTPPY
jgi:hypothetical protein